MLFLKNIADRHNYELIDTKLEIMLGLLDLLDRFVLKSDIAALLRHFKLLLLQALQVRLHSHTPKRCCKQARVVIAVTQIRIGLFKNLDEALSVSLVGWIASLV